MVSDAKHLEKPDASSDVDEDTSECDDISVDSSQQECDGALVLADVGNSKNPCFQNIEVVNSNDVHFGNKTYYQGPVTIKQIVYAKSNGTEEDSSDRERFAIKDECVVDTIVLNGNDNSGFVLDSVQQTDVYNKNNVDKDKNISTQKGKKWIPTLTRKRHIIIVSMVVCLVIALASLTAILLTKHLPNTSDPSYSEEDDAHSPEPGSGKLQIVNRGDWLSQEITRRETLKTPVSNVIILETGTASCSGKFDCIFHVRHLQTYFIESLGQWDIGYNFLVDNEGIVYEGRGWTVVGHHTLNWDEKSIGIAFIGTFETVQPSKEQINSAKQLIRIGTKKGYIVDDYKLYASVQLSKSDTGKLLYENVKTWDHWSNK